MACGQNQITTVDTTLNCGKDIIIFESDKAKMVEAGVSADFWKQLKDHSDKYDKCMEG